MVLELQHSPSETRAYNDDDTLASISFSGAAIGDLGSSWDANKNKTSKSIGGIMSGDGFTAEHDGLHRLHTAERGQLDVSHSAISAPQFNQCWTLDPTGNWQGFRQDDDGSGSWDLIQARTVNPVNEITGIDNTTGLSWATPAYDANGNTTSLPRPDLGADKSTITIWDAWNRPVRFRDPDTDHTLAEFGYDARNFRVLHRAFTDGSPDHVRHFYFTDRWQAIEERLGSSPAPERQHIWGLRYIDDLLLRDRAPSGSGSLSERLYFPADANWNITAAVDTAGAAQERIECTPYGLPQFLAPSFVARTTSLYDIRYSYTGREWLPELGIYYFRNRLYSPLLGRFVSQDPIGFEGSQWNVYEYSGSSPINYVDPSGKKFCGCIIAAACMLRQGAVCAGFCGIGHWDNVGDTWVECWVKCRQAELHGTGKAASDVGCIAALVACVGEALVRGSLASGPQQLPKPIMPQGPQGPAGGL